MLQIYYKNVTEMGNSMNLYEAIYERRSIRSYVMEALEEELLQEIQNYFYEIEPLYSDIRSEVRIIRHYTDKEKVGVFCNVKAPYYMALYAEDKERRELNAGYLMQHMSLYLESKGLGSCFIGMAKKSDKELAREGLSCKILLAFGISKNSGRKSGKETHRLSMDELCIYKEQPKTWVKSILETARLSPSSMNCQPWRFVVYENRIHVFSRKNLKEKGMLSRLQAVNFGIMLANVMVTAEELWVDLDLIKLNNITHKNIPNNQYVISILLKP